MPHVLLDSGYLSPYLQGVGVLSFLKDCHLPRVPDLCLENVKGRHLVLNVCAQCVFCGLLSMVFLFGPCCSHNTAHRFGRPTISKNSLAVPTLMIAIAGLLKTNTQGRFWISTRSSCASRSFVVQDTQSSIGGP